MSLITEFSADKLNVKIYSNRMAMGVAAADNAADVINKLLKEKAEIRMIFAAAPSQNDFLDALIQKDIDWSKIVAFHMDEYIGLEKDNPNLFGNFLKKHLFDKVNFKKVNYLETYNGNTEELCNNYSKLLYDAPVDIVAMGIGENGHIAFNDPFVADFNDQKLVKAVEIDQVSRQQQVNDGCFVNLEDVPKKAVTLSVPALLSATYRFVVVPGELKANAVAKTINDEISNSCPSTILRSAENTVLYLDKNAAKVLKLQVK